MEIFRSDDGLILTSSQYLAIDKSDSWRYWRTKITSVFQMNRIVVVGHSLSDKNIKHVLDAAKRGAGVQQPICWIAPDVTWQESKEFLERYRIRVIPYDNRDGKHRNLLRLIENITDFIPPRTSIHIRVPIAHVAQSPLGQNAAAPGFFVFNKLAKQTDFDEKRVDIVLAAIQSILPKLAGSSDFDVKTALGTAGWPDKAPLDRQFAQRVRAKAIEENLLVSAGTKLKVASGAEIQATENRKRFEHSRGRFKDALVLRLKSSYPSLSESDFSQISADIEASLSGYFREGGLTLATTLFSNQPSRQSPIPTSIVRFIKESSARYDDLLKRQAFFTVSVDAFVRSGTAEREYLGRIAQGFFAFHALGVFGDVAIERQRHAQQTVWLVDSNAQIPTLALAAPTNAVFMDSFSRLHGLGIRFFTTDRLFDETYDHLRFARNVIQEYGVDSHLVIAAALGQAPYRKSNQFLEGFIRWQRAGNPCDWENYLFQILRGTESGSCRR